jgi:hypothetical protein
MRLRIFWEGHMNRRNIISPPAIAALAVALLPGGAVSQQRPLQDQLVGTWMLVSNTGSRADARNFGPNDGVAVFEANGRFSLLLVRSDLPKFASNNRDTGTPEGPRSHR